MESTAWNGRSVSLFPLESWPGRVTSTGFTWVKCSRRPLPTKGSNFALGVDDDIGPVKLPERVFGISGSGSAWSSDGMRRSVTAFSALRRSVRTDHARTPHAAASAAASRPGCDFRRAQDHAEGYGEDDHPADDRERPPPGSVTALGECCVAGDRDQVDPEAGQTARRCGSTTVCST